MTTTYQRLDMSTARSITTFNDWSKENNTDLRLTPAPPTAAFVATLHHNDHGTLNAGRRLITRTSTLIIGTDGSVYLGNNCLRFPDSVRDLILNK